MVANFGCAVDSSVVRAWALVNVAFSMIVGCVADNEFVPLPDVADARSIIQILVATDGSIVNVDVHDVDDTSPRYVGAGPIADVYLAYYPFPAAEIAREALPGEDCRLGEPLVSFRVELGSPPFTTRAEALPEAVLSRLVRIDACKARCTTFATVTTEIEGDAGAIVGLPDGRAFVFTRQAKMFEVGDDGRPIERVVTGLVDATSAAVVGDDVWLFGQNGIAVGHPDRGFEIQTTALVDDRPAEALDIRFNVATSSIAVYVVTRWPGAGGRFQVISGGFLIDVDSWSSGSGESAVAYSNDHGAIVITQVGKVFGYRNGAVEPQADLSNQRKYEAVGFVPAVGMLVLDSISTIFRHDGTSWDALPSGPNRIDLARAIVPFADGFLVGTAGGWISEHVPEFGFCERFLVSGRAGGIIAMKAIGGRFIALGNADGTASELVVITPMP